MKMPIESLRPGLPFALLLTLMSCTTAAHQPASSPNRVAGLDYTPPPLSAAELALPPAPPSHFPPAPKDCPLNAWQWSRWSDNEGLHVIGLAVSPPGWLFSFNPDLQVISASEVSVTLLPKRTSTPPQSSIPGPLPGSVQQHVYGFWRRPVGTPPAVIVDVHCGRFLVERAGSLPMALPPDPPQPPKGKPPTPPRP